MTFVPLDVTAMTFARWGQPCGTSVYQDINVHRFPAERAFWTQFLNVGRRILTQGLRPFDVIHAMGMSSVAVAASVWGQLLRIPVIRELTLDGPLPDARGILGGIHRRGFTHASLLIASIEPIRKRLSSAGIPPERIWRRPHPVDLSVFHPPNETERTLARSYFGFVAEDVVHVLLARFHPRKNQLFAIEVLSQLSDEHKLLIVGPVFPEDKVYLQKVEEAVREFRLSDRVVIKPHELERSTLAYHAANTYWLPSHREGLANVMLEALCCGVPVIANQKLNVSEYLEEGVNGIVVPLNPQIFAMAIGNFLDQIGSHENREHIGRDAHLRFSAEKIDAEFASRLLMLAGE